MKEENLPEEGKCSLSGDFGEVFSNLVNWVKVATFNTHQSFNACGKYEFCLIPKFNARQPYGTCSNSTCK